MLELKGAKVLVIGGAGFIGSHVVKELLSYPVSEIIIFDNFARGNLDYISEYLVDERCSVYENGGDIREIDVLNDAVRGCDYVIHLAAMWLLQPVWARGIRTVADKTMGDPVAGVTLPSWVIDLRDDDRRDRPGGFGPSAGAHSASTALSSRVMATPREREELHGLTIHTRRASRRDAPSPPRASSTVGSVPARRAAS